MKVVQTPDHPVRVFYQHFTLEYSPYLPNWSEPHKAKVVFGLLVRSGDNNLPSADIFSHMNTACCTLNKSQFSLNRAHYNSSCVGNCQIILVSNRTIITEITPELLVCGGTASYLTLHIIYCILLQNAGCHLSCKHAAKIPSNALLADSDWQQKYKYLRAMVTLLLWNSKDRFLYLWFSYKQLRQTL